MMNIWKYVAITVFAGVISMNGFALAEEMTAAGCEKPGAPAQLQGQVVKVDVAQGKITVRDTNGTIHEFQASKETIQEYKVGDPIKAKLRCN